MIEAARARRDPHRHRGAARAGGAALVPASAATASPPPTTRAFPNMCAARFACRRPGAMRCCGASTRRRRRDGGDARRCAASSPRAASPICAPWSRGVDRRAVRSGARDERYPSLPRPIFLIVGRVARRRRTSPAFLALDLPGSKVVVGDGPQLAELRRRYPATRISSASARTASWRALYASADVFVFPSRTDTFGLVHARGAGLGRAGRGLSGAGPARRDRRQRRRRARRGSARRALAALAIPREHCRAHALGFNWAACARQFVDSSARCGA